MPKERRGWNEWLKFRQWFLRQYGMFTGIPLNLFNFKDSPYYLFWVEQGRPERKIGPPSTEQEMLEQLRSTATKEGTIPYKGNEAWKEYLGSRGWQLVETDVFGKLAPEKMFYQRKEVTPEEKLSPEETALEERVRRRDELELALMERQLGEMGTLSPWQKAQLEQTEKARADEAEKRRWAGQYESAQQETLRLMNLLNRPTGDQDRQRMALDWENMRQLTLSNLLTNPNRNWIAIQQAQGQRNPHIPQPQISSDDTFEQLREQVKQADAAKKYADDLEKSYASDPTKSLNFNQQTMIETARAAWTTARQNYLQATLDRGRGATRAETGLAPLPPGPGTPEQEVAGYWSTPRQTGIGQFEVGEPGTMPEANPMPKIPGWLAQATGISGLVPRAGTKREIAPPSGQMWATLNPIQQAKYAGFVDWAGTKPFEELLHQTQVQLPRSPSLGGTRWTPARQMV